MKTQKRKVEGKFLCVLMAIAVLMSLIVLPLAETIKQDASFSDSRYSDSDAADEGGSECVTDSQGAGKADFIYKNDDITVKAVFSDLSEIPDNTELQVTPITEGKDSGKYSEVKAQVNENVQADNQTVTGFLAYDIYFMVNGTKYEPENGTVTVTIQYNHPLFDEKVKKATDEIKVLHFKETGTETKVEDVTKTVDVADVGKDAATESKASSAVSSTTETKAEESPQVGSVTSSEANSPASSDAGSKAANADTVEFVTKSFSTFVVAGVAATTATNTITADAIADGLGIAGSFAVFAQNMALSSHMDGNIATNKINYSSGNIGNTNNVYTYNAQSSGNKFDLKISVSPGSTNDKVGIYTDSAGKTKISGSPFTMNTDGTKTVTGLDSKSLYYAYLLDISGNPIITSGTTVQGSTGGGSVAFSDNDSYINNITSSAFGSEVFQQAQPGSTIMPQSVTFGSKYLMYYRNSATGGESYPKTGDGTYGLVEAANKTKFLTSKVGGGVSNTVTIAEPDTSSTINFPIKYNDAFSSLSSLSSILSSAASSSAVKVIKVTPTVSQTLKSALATTLNIDQNSLDNKTTGGIPLNSNQYLVINVDCKNSASVTIPRCCIGGADFTNGWTDMASRVIWNFYNSNSAQASNVVVSTDDWVLGTILAPSATVNVDHSMCGAVYANTVTVGGELHKLSFRATTNVTREISFTVPSCNTTSLTVKKVWSDCGHSNSRPLSIIVRLLRNGVDVNQTGTLTSFDGWAPYTFNNLPLNDDQGQPYTYSVQENAVPYYTATYSTPAATSISTLCTCPSPCDKTITITNTYSPSIVLPSTGGTGTNLFYGAGVGIILFSAVLMIIYQLLEKQTKKRKGRRWRINS